MTSPQDHTIKLILVSDSVDRIVAKSSYFQIIFTIPMRGSRFQSNHAEDTSASVTTEKGREILSITYTLNIVGTTSS